jgi:hypothetical protein
MFVTIKAPRLPIAVSMIITGKKAPINAPFVKYLYSHQTQNSIVAVDGQVFTIKLMTTSKCVPIPVMECLEKKFSAKNVVHI